MSRVMQARRDRQRAHQETAQLRLARHVGALHCDERRCHLVLRVATCQP